jgi:hypothetical protein
MRGAWHICAVLALCASSAAFAADEEPICADRPGKATSTCAVSAGHWQIETGLADWTLEKGAGERDTTLAVGGTTIKYGLSDRSNIEVDINPWQRATSRLDSVHESVSGFGDVNVLYKQQITSADAPVQVDALPFVKIPTAKHSLGDGKWEGGLLVPIGFSIPKSPLAVALTPEVDWVADADGNGHHAAMAQVASLGWAVTDKLSLSAEIWGAWDWDPAGTTREASADGSVAYLVGSDVQLDAGTNVGLNRNTPDVELYCGMSFRF